MFVLRKGKTLAQRGFVHLNDRRAAFLKIGDLITQGEGHLVGYL